MWVLTRRVATQFVQEAVASGRYSKVLRVSRHHEKHYGLTDVREYFAKMSGLFSCAPPHYQVCHHVATNVVVSHTLQGLLHSAFAEAYLGTSDFFPFVRAELAEYDPTAYVV